MGDHAVLEDLADLGDVGVLGQVDGEGQAATAAVEQMGRRAGDTTQVLDLGLDGVDLRRLSWWDVSQGAGGLLLLTWA